MADLTPIIVPILSFGSVAAIVLVAGRHYAVQVRMRQRLPARTGAAGLAGEPSPHGLHAFLARSFDERRLGINAARRERLRGDLLKAGYFGSYGFDYYVLARIGSAVGFPLLVYVLTQFFSSGVPALVKLLTILIAVLVGFAGPDAYLGWRQRQLARRYRRAFPDLLDLLVVCIDAGMTIEGAFNRVQPEIMKRCWELGKNIELMGAETRAGRSTIEALGSLADRLNLDEAGSFVAMLRQSIELGSDTADALRVFSDEMREKRLLRAEETANKLSVKMVIPLGLFIFPVVLLVIMLPVIIKLLAVLR
ncbi:MAG TPA: type II secretion system F family protein [Xanthobacteraceae bacterium]|jgi:tight adherence protein C